MHLFLKITIFCAVILTAVALYRTPLNSRSFILDDDTAIAGNYSIRSFDLPKIFNTFNTRFLAGLSFAMNYKLNGLNPTGYRVFNLAVHLLNGVLVYFLIKSIFKGELVSLFASLLFLFHPINTEPVNYITQRFVLMGSFFYILTVVLYLRDKYIASILSAVCAMFCKEFVVTLPLMLVLCELYFKDRNFKKVLPFFAIALIVPLLLLRTPRELVSVAAIADIDYRPHHEVSVDITKARQGYDRKEYFLTELNVVCTYIRLLFVPINQVFDYDYPMSNSLSGKTLLCGGFLVGLIAFAVRSFNHYRMISFGILWFFLALSVDSSIIPIGHVISEYRVYLASVGFVMIISSLLSNIDLRMAILASSILLIGLSFLTYQRNKVWESDITLWTDSSHKCPNNPRIYGGLGDAYRRAGNIPQAIIEYDKSIAVAPNDADGYLFMGNFYELIKEKAKAILYFDRAIALNPSANAYINRGCFYYRTGQQDKAWNDYHNTVKLLDNDIDTRFKDAFVEECRG